MNDHEQLSISDKRHGLLREPVREGLEMNEGNGKKRYNRKLDRNIRIIKQFIRFSFVGVTCFAIDYGIMVLLTEVFDIRYLISSGISFVIATTVNYFLSSRFVFDHVHRGRMDLIVFIVLGAVGLGLNQLLMWWFVEIVGISYLIAKFGAGILVSFYNFISRKRFLERDKKIRAARVRRIREEREEERKDESRRQLTTGGLEQQLETVNLKQREKAPLQPGMAGKNTSQKAAAANFAQPSAEGCKNESRNK